MSRGRVGRLRWSRWYMEQISITIRWESKEKERHQNQWATVGLSSTMVLVMYNRLGVDRDENIKGEIDDKHSG